MLGEKIHNVKLLEGDEGGHHRSGGNDGPDAGHGDKTHFLEKARTVQCGALVQAGVHTLQCAVNGGDHEGQRHPEIERKAGQKGSDRVVQDAVLRQPQRREPLVEQAKLGVEYPHPPQQDGHIGRHGPGQHQQCFIQPAQAQTLGVQPQGDPKPAEQLQGHVHHRPEQCGKQRPQKTGIELEQSPHIIGQTDHAEIRPVIQVHVGQRDIGGVPDGEHHHGQDEKKCRSTVQPRLFAHNATTFFTPQAGTANLPSPRGFRILILLHVGNGLQRGLLGRLSGSGHIFAALVHRHQKALRRAPQHAHLGDVGHRLSGLCRLLDGHDQLVRRHFRVLIGLAVGRGAAGGLGQRHPHLGGGQCRQHLADGLGVRLGAGLQHTDSLHTGVGRQRVAVGQRHVGQGGHAKIDARVPDAGDQPRPPDDCSCFAFIEQGGHGVIVAVRLQRCELFVVFHPFDGLGIVEPRLAFLVQDVAAKPVDEGGYVVGGGVLVDHSIGACRRVGVGLHISIQIFGGGGDIPLPQRLVVQKDQRLKIHGQEVLLAADLAGFHRHRQGVCQNIRARYLRQGSQNVHGHKGAQGVMGVEIHVRAVCRVASVQLQLVGKAGLFLKCHCDVVAGKLRVHSVGNGLHDGLVAVVPDLDGDRLCGRFAAGRRRAAALGRAGGRLATTGQHPQRQSRAQQKGNCLFHGVSSFFNVKTLT